MVRKYLSQFGWGRLAFDFLLAVIFLWGAYNTYEIREAQEDIKKSAATANRIIEAQDNLDKLLYCRQRKGLTALVDIQVGMRKTIRSVVPVGSPSIAESDVARTLDIIAKRHFDTAISVPPPRPYCKDILGEQAK